MRDLTRLGAISTCYEVGGIYGIDQYDHVIIARPECRKWVASGLVELESHVATDAMVAE